jgi:hypothetical protein
MLELVSESMVSKKILMEDDQVFHMFALMQENVHKRKLDQIPAFLHQKEKETGQLTTIDGICSYNITVFIDGVDLGRLIDFEGTDPNLGEDDKLLLAGLVDVIKTNHPSVQFFLNYVRLVQGSENHVDRLLINYGLFYHDHEKKDILAEIEKLRI